MPATKVDPSLLQSARPAELGDRFNQTLFSAIEALDEAKIEYALIGGVASSGLGRPRSTHDIDVFLRPEDSGLALEALSRQGFQTEKTDFNWLFKAFKEGILVDVIFKSRGDIYFDHEMAERSKPVEFHGRKVRTVAPEDLIIIKCAVHDELGPHHWHDALAVLSHAQIDWEYLLKRGRRAQRRLLALLLYAQSNDIWVPNKVVFELFRTVYGEFSTQHPGASVYSSTKILQGPGSPGARTNGKRIPDQYLIARIKNALTQDQRAGDQDIKVYVENDRVLLRGEVVSEEHRKLVEDVVRDNAKGYQIENQLKVSVLTTPESAEDVG